ncbi:MAG: M23 family metallopeptidase [Alphaproteobacteria bacterium]|nr:M23 family metallopeptidase [Alphaproteobacteria bacterium]
MRLSTLAALMILTTIMLSACSQQNFAQVIDNSGQYYGQDSMPKYSSWNPAPENPQTAFKYQNSDAYSVEAEVGSVSSHDLAPPTEKVTTTSLAEATPAPAITPTLSPKTSSITTTAMGEWQWPVQGKTSSASEGIVIAAGEGSPIRAAGEGTVAYVGNQPDDFGNIVIIRHANGAMTSYAHAREILVSNGDYIKQGDLLGYVGKTGNVTSPQLHFGMRVADASVNPLDYLPQSLASR